MRNALLTFALCAALTACGDGQPTEPPPEAPSTGGEQQEPGDTQPGGDTGAGGEMCGGIAGTPCPEGQWCDLEGDHPDAAGACRPNGECDEPADCEVQDLVHAMCVGEWACTDGACAWECQ
jgi:hypothetical protein